MRTVTTIPAERPLILADRGCPYAQRVLALLEHLGVACDVRESAVGRLPQGIERWSPSGRVPLLVHGPIVIGESRVMLEYIAEAYGFAAAYPEPLIERTHHRHAMATMDQILAPTLMPGAATLAAARLDECVFILETAALASPPIASLLAFHLAPMWLRFQWWQAEGTVTRAIAGRPKLVAWLDVAVSLPSVVRTSPVRVETQADYRAMCASYRSDPHS